MRLDFALLDGIGAVVAYDLVKVYMRSADVIKGYVWHDLLLIPIVAVARVFPRGRYRSWKSRSEFAMKLKFETRSRQIGDVT